MDIDKENYKFYYIVFRLYSIYNLILCSAVIYGKGALKNNDFHSEFA